MSIHLMSLVWEIQFPTQTQKLTMLKLADHADDSGGSVFPGNDTLAYQVGCDRRTIQRTVKQLASGGIIKLTHRGGKGDGDTNRWSIDVDQLIRLGLRELVLERDENGCLQAVENQGGELPPSNFARVTKVLRRVTPVSLEGDTAMSPEPSLTTNNKTPSASADARDGSRTPPAEKLVPAFTLTPDRDRAQWVAWLEYLREQNKDGLARAAETAGEMTVTSKWPNPEKGLRGLLEPRRENNTARMLGEAAE